MMSTATVRFPKIESLAREIGRRSSASLAAHKGAISRETANRVVTKHARAVLLDLLLRLMDKKSRS